MLPFDLFELLQCLSFTLGLCQQNALRFKIVSKMMNGLISIHCTLGPGKNEFGCSKQPVRMPCTREEADRNPVYLRSQSL